MSSFRKGMGGKHFQTLYTINMDTNRLIGQPILIASFTHKLI